MILNKILNKIKLIPEIIISLISLFKSGGFSKFEILYTNRSDLLKDKKILITGGMSGIGLAMAKKFSNDGALVLITGRDSKKFKSISKKLKNYNIKFIEWDVRKIKYFDTNLQKVCSILGGSIDILVNNAAIILDDDFFNISEDTWTDVYNTNSKSVFFLCQSICRKWLKEKNKNIKKIINISSQGGFVGATYPYRLTKWDIAGLTQGLAIKMIKHKIIVNGIAPGIVATKMVPQYLKEKNNIYCNINPIKRFAFPEEIAELAAFIASDSSNYIVGQTIVCDGGYSIR